MQTNQMMSAAIAIGAPRDDVLGLIADPTQTPRWAPVFADRVRPASDGRWTVSSGDREFEIRVLASSDAGTVDYLAPDEDRGLFARVVPNGEGSALVLTLVMPAATPADVVERQRGVLDAELDSVRALSEA